VVAANAASDWAQVAVTLLLGLVTAYIGLSIRQKRRQEIAVNVADHRLDAYAALWTEIPLSPELRKLRGDPPLTHDVRRKLFDQLTSWYYDDGHGMLLGVDTRSIYLTVKKNLICDANQFVHVAHRTNSRRRRTQRRCHPPVVSPAQRDARGPRGLRQAVGKPARFARPRLPLCMSGPGLARSAHA
jgi:hypothetical protein